MTRRLTLFPLVVLIALYATFMLKTNSRLTVLDDEGTIITTANLPTAERLHLFTSGIGEHLHPPLSDILLHEWLTITHHSFALLRVFSLIFYIAGLLILARCGQIMGNKGTFWAVLLLGMLWPFGYFYARITGWYSCSFFLVAAATYAYQLLLRQSSLRRWGALAAVAILLLWTNYFGIAILAVLFLDLLLFHRKALRENVRPLLLTFLAVAICFLPLMRALLADTHSSVKSAPVSWIMATIKVGFMLYAVLASVAVAPWFLWWSVPIILAAVVLFFALARRKQSGLYLLYYVLLVAGLEEQRLLDLKRLLFITPWLLLAIALSCTAAAKREAITAVAATLIIFAFGWLGIATRRHPATNNFYEPWASVAAQSAGEARRGSVIISDSTPYFFYLNYALDLEGMSSGKTYLGLANYRNLAGVTVYDENIPPALASSFPRVTVVTGIDNPYSMRKQAAILHELRRSCTLVSEQQSTPDPALNYKRVIEPNIALLQYRASVRRFDCIGGQNDARLTLR